MFQAFQEEVTKWQNDPSFMDRLFAAHGRFYSPFHQVQSVPYSLALMPSLQCLHFLDQGRNLQQRPPDVFERGCNSPAWYTTSIRNMGLGGELYL